MSPRMVPLDRANVIRHSAPNSLNYRELTPRDIPLTFARPEGIVLRMLCDIHRVPAPRNLNDAIARSAIQPHGAISTTEGTRS